MLTTAMGRGTGGRQALAMLAMALTVFAGFCLFGIHQDEEHGIGLDLCEAMIAAVATTIFTPALLAATVGSRPRCWTSTPTVPAVPDPPPWLSFRA